MGDWISKGNLISRMYHDASRDKIKNKFISININKLEAIKNLFT